MPQPDDTFIWTRIEGWKPRLSAGWLEIEYAQSLAAPLKRPLIRFSLDQGEHVVVGQAPLFGKGISVCRIPRGARSVDIAHGPEPEFVYRVVRHRAVNVLSLLPRALRNNASLALQAMGAVFIGAEREHEQALGFARGGIPFDDYDGWRARQWRAPALDDLDAALHPREDAPCFAVYTGAMEAGALAARYEHLMQQPGVRVEVLVPEESKLADRPGMIRVPNRPTLADLLKASPSASYFLQLALGSALSPAALAQVAFLFQRSPDAGVLYGDEDAMDEAGRYHSPLLKPDWSPLYESQRPYLGDAVFWKRAALAAHSHQPATALLTDTLERQNVLSSLGPSQVIHARRILVTHTASATSRQAAGAPGVALPCPSAVASPAEVAIIIANKNRLNLLKPCIDSIYEKSSFTGFEIIIIDNGSTEADVLAYYKMLEEEGLARVLFAPGAFNFSAMSNLGARHTKASWFIFLNNDMEVIAPDWIEQLRQHVMKPDVGTVGARLLFPSGLLQHAGVAVGIGGFADHLHHSEPGDTPGYLGRLSVPHELSACTGACLAVTREKFDAVGGFNEQDLPVELNDIDLCLKLGERGWKTVFEPRALLFHHQSASRGRALLPFSRYNGERAYFRAHWLEAIRDDPYFHPALSEYAVTPVLAG